MKKIPSLFMRDRSIPGVQTVCRDEVTPGCEWVLEGIGIATRKYDGACCMLKDGKFFKRYDAKHGKTPPKDFTPAQEPDPITGHWTGWVPVERKPEDKWFNEALHYSFINSPFTPPLQDGTYEACGPHFNANPEGLKQDQLIRHGNYAYTLIPSFMSCVSYDNLREFLSVERIEGLVFYHPDGERMAKVKRKDFGLEWGKREGK